MIYLDVLVVSYGRRVENLQFSQLPPVEGLRYLISIQNPENLNLDADIERLKARADIKVTVTDTIGSSNNRNHAIGEATADYVLIADDDVDYDADGLRKLVQFIRNEPNYDYIAVKVNADEGRVFPPDRYNIQTPWRFHSPICFEIVVRRQFLLENKLKFSPLTGVNAPFLSAGEEDLFVHHIKQAGARSIYRDICIGTHRGPTTSVYGSKRPSVLASKGMVLRAIYGPFESLLRYPLEAWRSKALWVKAMYWYMRGYLYYQRHRGELKRVIP